MRKQTASSKRKYDSDDSKKRLLKAGLDIFSKRGFDAATTREIAKQAGVNLSLIPRYFKNKEGLFFAIVEDFHKRFTSEIPYPACDTLRDELTRFFEYRVEFALKNKKLLRLFIVRSILSNKFREDFGQLMRVGVPWLIERVRKLQAEGKCRKDVSPERISFVIGGIAFSVNMFTEIAFNVDKQVGLEAFEQAVTALCEGLQA